MPWTTLPDGSVKIDVRPYILAMRDLLHNGADPKKRDEILTALQRWVHDAMLNDESRSLAHEVVVAFAAPEIFTASCGSTRATKR